MTTAEHHNTAQKTDVCLTYAQDIVKNMLGASTDAAQHERGEDARAALLAMRDDFIPLLEGPHAIGTIQLLQRLVNIDVEFGHVGFGTYWDLCNQSNKRVGTDLVIGLSDELIGRAQNSADPATADAATDLLFDAVAAHSQSASYATRLFLVNGLPNIVRCAIQSAQQKAAALGHDADGLHIPLVIAAERFHRVALLAGSEEQKRQLLDVCAQAVANADSDPYWKTFTDSLTAHGPAVATLSHLANLPTQAIEHGWNSGYHKPHDPKYAAQMDENEYMAACAKSLIRLENQEPGICRELFRRNRIRNYARYPDDLLITQYRNRSNTSPERFDFLSALRDSNGSALYNSMPKIHDAITELARHGVLGEVTEIDSGQELRTCGRVARMSGRKPARYVFADFHGDWDSVTAGETFDDRDIHSWLGTLTTERVARDGVVIVNSCVSGRDDNGFAAILHYTSGREVHGSRAGTWLRKLFVLLDRSGQVHLDADIRYSEKWKDTPGEPTRHFTGNPMAAKESGDTAIQEIASAIRQGAQALPAGDVFRASQAFSAAAGIITAASNGSSPELQQISGQLAETAGHLSALLAQLNTTQEDLRTHAFQITHE